MIVETCRQPRAPVVSPGGIELFERDMTATFAADVTLAAAQARLAEIGQWLAIDGDPQTPLGDLIAFNSTGALRLGYGGWRDNLLGIQFNNGRGELISAGGRTLKNVAGYDLTKWMVGSAGMFGTIVTLTVRTYRRPEAALLITHPADVHLLGRVITTPLRPQWALLGSEQLLFGYLGDRRTVDFYLAQIAESETEAVKDWTLDEDIAHRARLWRTEGETSFRGSVPPTQIAELAADLDCQSWIGDPAFGVVLGSNLTADRIPLLNDAARQLGGSIRFFTRAEPGKPPVIDFTPNPVERQIVERLKRAFDPDGALTPLPWERG